MTGQRWIPAWDRFWARVTEDPDTHCWVWNNDKTKRAQTLMVDAVRHAPYRWSYEQFIGPIPPGMTIDHLCRFSG